MSKELTTRIAEIRKKVVQLNEQNSKMKAKLETMEAGMRKLNDSFEAEAKKNSELNNQIKIIKLARNIGSTDSESADVKELKRKINEYIKEIDHCITMLND